MFSNSRPSRFLFRPFECFSLRGSEGFLQDDPHHRTKPKGFATDFGKLSASLARIELQEAT
jgi:hypothetical protein